MPIVFLGLIAALLVLLQRFVYKRLWKMGLSFNVRFSAKEAFEGEKLYLQEELTNRKFLPLPWVNTKLVIPPTLTFLDSQGEAVSPKGAGSSLYSVMLYTSIRRRKHFVCRHRGVYNFRNAKITASNLMYTQQLTEDFPIKANLMVFPKILECDDNLASLYKLLDAAILSNQLINPDPFEFRGIRDYEPTDALKTVNFKASAIEQKLMVNIHAPTSAKRLVLVLNFDHYKKATSAELYEQSIRLAGTLAHYYIGEGAAVSFYTNGRDSAIAKHMRIRGGTSEGHLYKIFECLARISLSLSAYCTSIDEYINGLVDREHVYLFISPYYGDDLLSSVQELIDRGVDAYMVVPAFDDAPVSVAESDRLIIWNAGSGL